ncbi:MAG: hypothetical protein ABJM22_12785 [Balneola sp.]
MVPSLPSRQDCSGTPGRRAMRFEENLFPEQRVHPGEAVGQDVLDRPSPAPGDAASERKW